jgi:AAHS family 4-hydroxybenzoate transporter-like MFS transporter
MNTETNNQGSSTVINISKIIDESSVSKYQYRVIIICFIVAMIDGFDTQAVAFVAPILSEEMDFGSQSIGNLYSAGLFGLMVGAITFGNLADKIGRKPVTAISCLLMGIFSLLAATSSSLNELLIYRFCTGLGIGAAMPNINSLTAEYSPKKKQAFLMTLMFAGFPFGAVLGGMLSVKLIELYSWPSVFVLGGVTPILMVVVIYLYLPESLRFLAAKDKSDSKIGETLKRIDPSHEVMDGTTYTVDEIKASQTKKTPLLEIFQEGRASATVAIWTLYGANFMMMYSVLGWLPTVMRDAGLGLSGGI